MYKFDYIMCNKIYSKIRFNDSLSRWPPTPTPRRSSSRIPWTTSSNHGPPSPPLGLQCEAFQKNRLRLWRNPKNLLCVIIKIMSRKESSPKTLKNCQTFLKTLIFVITFTPTLPIKLGGNTQFKSNFSLRKYSHE